MAGVSKAVSDTLFLQAQTALKGLGKTGEISRKLQAIIAAKKFGVSLAAKVFDTSRPSLMAWIKSFEHNASDGLKLKSGRGRKSVIDSETKEIVRQYMRKNPNATNEAVRQYIKEKRKIAAHISTVNRLMKQLGLSYITPRPKHYKADRGAQEEFKKNSGKKSKDRH